MWRRVVSLAFPVLIAALLSGCGVIVETVTQFLVAPSATPTVAPTATIAPTKIPPLTEIPANALEGQIISVFEQTGQAVVNITSKSYSYDFFMRAVPQEGTGSGFLYDGNGNIVTNYHVVANAQSVSVALADGKSYEAKVVGEDPSSDLAVIRIAAKDLPTPLVVGDSDTLRIGQFVVAIGNPFGLERTLTVGVISSLGRVIQSPDGRFIGEAIQTDAAINPGNSGGPLLDLKGRVIGVNSQIISPSQASAGIGFAVSANTVRRVVPQLIAHGRYPHPWLGVYLLDLTPERVDLLRQAGAQFTVKQGVLIMEATSGGPAALGGLRGGDRTITVGNARIPVGGDVIVALGGKPIANQRDLMVYLDTQTRVGDKLEVTVIRDGKELRLTVALQERPRS